MPQRVVRVNELIKREISEILHTRYQSESVYITVTAVDTAADLRRADVFYSVLGDEERALAVDGFFQASSADIRRMLARRIVLKYLPELHFHEDDSIARGIRLNKLLDDLGLPGESEEPPGDGEST